MKIKIIIDRIEENKAILKGPNNETIEWPVKSLPENSKEGSILFFNINLNEEEEKNSKQLAKDILNEILKGGK